MKQRDVEEAGGYLPYLNKKFQKYNYLMQVVRTTCSTIVVALQVIILLRLFGII